MINKVATNIVARSTFAWEHCVASETREIAIVLERETFLDCIYFKAIISNGSQFNRSSLTFLIKVDLHVEESDV